MNFAQPAHIDEALSLLAGGDWSILCGGTDFFPSQDGGRAPGNVLDISKIQGLDSITSDEDHWSIGALVTWSDLIGAKMPPAFDALKLAGREVGSIQIQNRATIAGNICNASPAADGLPPLLCLDAKVRLSSTRGERILPLEKFVTGNRQIVLKQDEMVTHILVPSTSTSGISTFKKLGARKYLVISIAMVAVRLGWNSDGIVDSAAISVGSCSVVARRLEALEKVLLGENIFDDISGHVQEGHFDCLSPIDDVRATADYRMSASVELVRRSLRDLAAPQ